MEISRRGIEFITKFEGFSNRPYLCPAKIPTIGFGSTYYSDGTHVTLQDKEITKEEGYKLLKTQLKHYENAVNRYVITELLQCQFDALTSFVYNVGANNFKTSTLLKKINKDNYDKDIEHEFHRWNKAGGRILKGLILRREKEAELYFSEIAI